MDINIEMQNKLYGPNFEDTIIFVNKASVPEKNILVLRFIESAPLATPQKDVASFKERRIKKNLQFKKMLKNCYRKDPSYRLCTSVKPLLDSIACCSVGMYVCL
jgi:hypothetical protein